MFRDRPILSPVMERDDAGLALSPWERLAAQRPGEGRRGTSGLAFGSLAERVAGFMATAVAARHYTLNLLLDASTRYADLDKHAMDALAVARHQLAESVGAVTAALAPAPAADPAGEAGAGDAAGQPARQYVRSASLFERVADALPGQPLMSRPHLALRDLQLLDGALAEAARWAGVPVTDLDTVPARR